MQGITWPTEINEADMKEFLSRGGGSEKTERTVGVNKGEEDEERFMWKNLGFYPEGKESWNL